MNTIKHILKILLFFTSLGGSSVAIASFNIDLDFSNSTITNSQQTIITQATDFWNTTIVDYKDPVHPIIDGGFTISATAEDLGGVNGTLASASTSSFTDPFSQYTYTTGGSISFDTYDIGNLEDNGTLFDIALHEIAHILGFGSLWEANDLYNAESGEYTGVEGLAAYQAEFDPLADFVPVELDGGDGTANGHWDENNNGSGLTGITDLYGNDMSNELMTGWANGDMFISNTTLASFADLGYTISAVPLPTSLWLFASALGFLGFSTNKKVI